tara:strand:+ start:65 stop:439 length:375 start_codon:yes stop_codon:yes gene_type:complete
VQRLPLFEVEKLGSNSVKKVAFANNATVKIPVPHDRHKDATASDNDVSSSRVKPRVVFSVVKTFCCEGPKYILRCFSSQNEAVDHLGIVWFETDFNCSDGSDRSGYPYESRRFLHRWMISINIV